MSSLRLRSFRSRPDFVALVLPLLVRFACEVFPVGCACEWVQVCLGTYEYVYIRLHVRDVFYITIVNARVFQDVI